ncbi:MAG: hypothetical protein U1E67_10750 [Hyphomicrobiales bacterium]
MTAVSKGVTMTSRYVHIAVLAAMVLGAIPAAAPTMADDQPTNQQGKPSKKKITPSAAAVRAQQMNPGSTVLEVKDAGNKYIVTLKTPGELKRVAIPNSP